MDIHVLGAHNCESKASKFVSLLVDDVLVLDAGGLTSALSFKAQARIQAILLTHHHYDHIRDVPAIAMNFFVRGETLNIFSTKSVQDVITNHLLNDTLYPRFLEKPPWKPTVKFTVIKPYDTEQVEGYNISACPVNHSDSAVGFEVVSPDGRSLFYTGDTGSGLAGCWKYVSPQLLIIEVTVPNSYEEFATESKHLTPDLLKRELVSFRQMKGYLPRVLAVHMNPDFQKEIEGELEEVARDLEAEITVADEGMRIHL